MKALALLLALPLAVGAVERTQANVSGVAGNGQSGILFLSSQGSCPKGTQEAVLITPATKAIFFACWAARDGQVYIEFDDGDKLNLEEKSIHWYQRKS
jgi:hypothetical protein